MAANNLCMQLRESDRFGWDHMFTENGWTCCNVVVQHLHTMLRSSRDVLGEVREAGVSEQSGSQLEFLNLIGWLLLDHPARF